MNDQKPIIFLAFANDHSDKKRYLRSLPDEQRQLHDILKQVEDEGLCKLEEAPFATIKDILDVFQKYRDQIAVFHFAGHSDSYELLLEAVGGKVEVANAGGLAAFLGEQKGLRLVFLNGCSNREQVQGLLEANIPAVIATSHDILDPVAMDFASRFYNGLANKAPIRTAYNEAKAGVETKFGAGQSRGALRRKQAAPSDQWPWDLYLQEGDEIADQWSLVTPIVENYRFRLPYEPETIYIPAGSFLIGSEPGEGVSKWETPQHEVELPAYRIGKYPIINEEFAEFIRQTGRPVAPTAGWEGQSPPADKLNYPLVGITWYDALAYCEWLSERTGRSYTLPSEVQWEKAARGTDGRIYPWGNDWDENRCNHDSDQITPKDAYSEGSSPYGCYDMVGNVREWTRTIWGVRRHVPQFRYPWANDGRDDLSATKLALRIYRGGAANDPIDKLRCSARNAYSPDRPGPPEKRHGFRVVVNMKKS
jgi:formylglycine-generating enzyme required for sulfatase activity